MPKNPILAGSNKSPTGQSQNIKLAFGENKRRWRRIAARVAAIVEKLPHTKIAVPKDEAPTLRKQDKRTLQLTNMADTARWFALNAEFEIDTDILRNEQAIFNAYRYEFEVSSALMDRTMDDIGAILMQDMLDGSDFWTSRFWLNGYLSAAFENGTLDSLDSAINITEGTPVESKIAIISAAQTLASPEYLDRLRLVNGRTFNLMRGLTEEMKAQLRLTLTESVARGLGVRDITGLINNRLGVGLVRAERIARTEIARAYNQAYMDEAKQLNKTALADDVWEIRPMQRSALAPTTRPHHAARHGKITTFQEMEDWWATGSNRLNCLCTTVDVLVNKKTGEVLQKKLHERMLEQKKGWVK